MYAKQHEREQRQCAPVGAPHLKIEHGVVVASVHRVPRGDDTYVRAFFFEAVFCAVVTAVFDARLFIEHGHRV